ncbi:MAG TPA: glycosyltransferase family 2 protein [Cytophagales bacterium]|nr:glycosyltransferase family 2 protein [Cytophagales bacterium]
MQPLVSIITVNYNQTLVTLELLASLKMLSYTNYEVIIVDNASRENPETHVKEQFPEMNIRVISSKVNLGFAGGNNLGIKESKGKYLFFVNNDIEITSDAIERILEVFATYPEAGAVSPKFHYYFHPNLIEYAGYNPVSIYTAKNTPVGGHEIDRGQYEEISETHYAHGGGMCVPRNVIEQVGMWPEVFFLYYEEFDWCEQIKKAGYKIYYQPKATIFHKESLTVGKGSLLKTYYLTRSRILFMRRNRSISKFLVFLAYFTCFTIPKNLFVFVKNREFLHIKAFSKAIFWNLGFNQVHKA